MKPNDINDRIVAACAYIEVRNTPRSAPSRGTGFLVRPDRVVTCHHVVTDQTLGGQVWVRFGSRELRASICEADEHLDFAILALESPIPDIQPLLLSDTPPQAGMIWHGCGFPSLTGDSILPLHGTLELFEGTDDKGRPALVLSSDRASAGQGGMLDGFSGTAVIIDGEVVGIVRRVIPGRGRTGVARAELGVVYACSIRPVIAKLPPWPDGARLPPPLRTSTAERLVRDGDLFGLREAWRRREEATGDRLWRQELKERPAQVVPPLLLQWWHFMAVPQWHLQLDELIRELAPLFEHLMWSEAKLQDIRKLRSRLGNNRYEDSRLEAIRALLEPLENEVLGARTKVPSTQGSRVRSREKLPQGPQTEKMPPLLWQRFRSLRSFLRKPSFSRCLLVTGGLGAGRTHLIASLLLGRSRWALPGGKVEEIVLKYPTLVLPLGRPYSGQRLADLIDIYIREMSNQQFDGSLGQLDQLLGEGLPVSKEGGRVPHRLVLVIDDLHTWPPNYFRELRDFIEMSTKFHSIYWLLTVQDTRFDYVVGRDVGGFWSKYGFMPQPMGEGRGQGPSEVNPGTLVPAAEMALARDTPDSIGPWLVLNSLNIVHSVGLKVIRAMTDGELGVLESIQRNQNPILNKESSTAETLCNPLFAWIATDLHLDNPAESSVARLAKLQYVGFIMCFCKHWMDSIELPDDVDRNELLACIMFIARFLIDTTDTSPPRTALLNAVVDMAKKSRTSELLDRKLAEKALLALSNGGLVRTLVDLENSEIGNHSPARYQFQFEEFWQWYCAQGMIASGDYPGENLDQEIKRLLLWSRRVDPLFGEGILIYFFQLFDSIHSGEIDISRAARSRSSVPYELKRVPGFSSSEPLKKAPKIDILLGVVERIFQSVPLAIPALFFAGPRISGRSQALLVDKVETITDPSMSSHVMFSIMYFLAEARREVLTVSRRFQVLERLLDRIAADGLSRYYLYMVNRHLTDSIDAEELFSCLGCFFDCGALDVVEEVARRAFLCLSTMAERERIRQIDKILQYIERSPKYSSKRKPDKDGRTFREWLLCHLCRSIVGKHGMAAFRMLRDGGWFFNRNLSNHHLREMNKEATIALAKWFRRHGSGEAGDEFVRTVNGLSRSQGGWQLRTAFFLIWHAFRNETEAEYCGDERFAPALARMEKSLASDSDSRWILDPRYRYRRIFDLYREISNTSPS